MMLYALLVGAMLLGSGALGYYVGKGRRSEYEKTRDRQYKAAVRDLDVQRASVLESSRKAVVYERALTKIATGRDKLPEVTASIAINEFN